MAMAPDDIVASTESSPQPFQRLIEPTSVRHGEVVPYLSTCGWNGKLFCRKSTIGLEIA